VAALAGQVLAGILHVEGADLIRPESGTDGRQLEDRDQAAFSGGTRRPQNATVAQVTAALGYVRRDELRGNGTVIIGFVKARDLNYQREIEKQATWLMRHRGPRRKRRNGKAPAK
jgi:hypothetical protein